MQPPTNPPSAKPSSSSKPSRSNRVEAILNFWFGHPASADYGQYRKAWFVKNPDFDKEIRQRFLTDYQLAASGKLNHWQETPRSSVAMLLLLDQFPRNLFRGQPQSFATDLQAKALSTHLVSTGQDKQLIPAQRFFIYVPFEHSEDLADQNRCVELMQNLVETVPDINEGLKGGLDYAIRHREVIQRFGRFPHRNEILGRPSTAEELEFLQQPGSRF